MFLIDADQNSPTHFPSLAAASGVDKLAATHGTARAAEYSLNRPWLLLSDHLHVCARCEVRGTDFLFCCLFAGFKMS
jgi:hypothetical protein